MNIKIIFTVVALCVPINAESFYRLDGFNYIFSYPERTTWHNALSICSSLGADLVYITSEEEHLRVNQILKDIPEGTNSPYTWIGGTDYEQLMDFYWIANHESFSYNQWCEDQPDNSGGDEYCVHYEPTKDGNNFCWNDLKCNFDMFYLCRERQYNVTVQF